jgi:hypothetical protein
MNKSVFLLIEPFISAPYFFNRRANSFLPGKLSKIPDITIFLLKKGVSVFSTQDKSCRLASDEMRLSSKYA